MVEDTQDTIMGYQFPGILEGGAFHLNQRTEVVHFGISFGFQRVEDHFYPYMDSHDHDIETYLNLHLLLNIHMSRLWRATSQR